MLLAPSQHTFRDASKLYKNLLSQLFFFITYGSEQLDAFKEKGFYEATC
jgi:hypothetical protein